MSGSWAVRPDWHGSAPPQSTFVLDLAEHDAAAKALLYYAYLIRELGDEGEFSRLRRIALHHLERFGHDPAQHPVVRADEPGPVVDEVR